MDSEQLLPPVPRALSDEDLQEVLEKAKAEGGGLLAAMQILEAQAQLRETDKSELRAWQASQTSFSEEENATAADEALYEEEPAPVTFEVFAPETISAPLEIIESVQTAVAEVESDIEVVVQTKRDARDSSSSQFWVWLTISGSLLPLGIALWLRSLGLTFAQSLTSAAIGMFVSAGIVAVGAIAGKRSSLPTLVLSRAAFGVFGNLAPAAVLVMSRLFWALVLVILGYILIAQSLTDTSGVLDQAAPVSPGAIAILLVIVIAAVILASYGGARLVWAQRISGVLGVATALTVFFARLVAHGPANYANQEGSWLRALGAAVVILAMFGLAWSSASADYASGLPVNVRGWKVAGWALIAMGVVTFVLTWLALVVFGDLASSDFAGSFSAVVAGADVGFIGILIQVSLVFTLLTTIAMSLRSSSKSFESVQLKLKAAVASPVIALLAISLAVLGLARLGSMGFWFNLHGYSLFLAVPVAAWSGVFVSDVLIRRIAYHEVSLSRGYGFYKSLNLTNVLGWLLAVALGWGLLKSDLVEFQWLGYLADFASNSEFWAQSNFGVVIAFALGLLLPVVAGIPRIKRQEAEVLLIEARRNDLKNVLGLEE
jgi:nucleobase:cation symporter-1, NCS1 family